MVSYPAVHTSFCRFFFLLLLLFITTDAVDAIHFFLITISLLKQNRSEEFRLSFYRDGRRGRRVDTLSQVQRCRRARAQIPLSSASEWPSDFGWRSAFTPPTWLAWPEMSEIILKGRKPELNKFNMRSLWT